MLNRRLFLGSLLSFLPVTAASDTLSRLTVEEVDNSLHLLGIPKGWEPFTPKGTGKVLFEVRSVEGHLMAMLRVFVRPLGSNPESDHPVQAVDIGKREILAFVKSRADLIGATDYDRVCGAIEDATYVA